ncbi:MAG: flagellin, partial [Gammaproteobacteria bacterium]|nr:flagellin [Gammaproteobacteria bacterium]
QNIRLEGNSSSITVHGSTSGSTLMSAASVSYIKGSGDVTGDGTTAGSSFGLSAASAAPTANTIYGGLKLSSVNGNSISIDLSTAASMNEIGLSEANSIGGGAGGTSISKLSVDSATNAQKAIDVIDNALNTVNGQRGDLGAVNNRLEFTVDNLQSVSQQTSAARSRILDADFAKESASLSRAQVLQQAGTAMLAQANSAPQQVLSILR